jgi:uncharacterized coiled-coil protein SlyX
MEEKIDSVKQIPIFSLLLGPVLTLLPLILVSVHSGKESLILVLISLASLFLSWAFSRLGLLIGAFLLTLSFVVLPFHFEYPFLLLGALITGLFITALSIDELKGGGDLKKSDGEYTINEQNPVPFQQVLEEKRQEEAQALSFKKLLALTRVQLQKEQAEKAQLQDKVTQLEAQLLQQDQASPDLTDELQEKKEKIEQMQLKLNELKEKVKAFEEITDEDVQEVVQLRRKAARYDQLKDQFEEKNLILSQLRKELFASSLELESLKREEDEAALSSTENEVKLKDQLLMAYSHIEMLQTQEENLYQLISKLFEEKEEAS